MTKAVFTSMANKLLVVTLMTVRDAIAVVACIRTNCPGAVKQLSVLIHHGEFM